MTGSESLVKQDLLLLDFEDARHLVERYAGGVAAPEVESVELLKAAGRVLAEEIVADRDFPPFPRSTRDGYAVRSVDLQHLPCTLQVIGEIKAGQKWKDVPAEVLPGQAVAIMTGAPVPTDCDAVVMVEFTSREGDGVRIAKVKIARAVVRGENMVPRGAEAREGGLLLERGSRLNDAAIAIAASVGRSRLNVFRKPRVAILSTGDELVGVEDSPGPTEIRNSNSYSLAAQVSAAGGEPTLLPIAPDEPRRLRELIEEGLGSDLLLLTGGVSMGRYDLVEQVLAEMQAEFFFTGAKIQPGKPVVFGRVSGGMGKSSGSPPRKDNYFFGLPGNPVSTMVTFELFARPMLEAMAGMKARALRFIHVRLKGEIRVKAGLRRFLPAILSREFENCVVELVQWQGSGDIAATARANCYVVIPPDREQFAAGEFVPVMKR